MPAKDARLVPYEGGNFGMPLELIDTLIVPTSLLFVRSNGGVPRINRQDWRLKFTGEVENQTVLTFDHLLALPQRTITAFLECAGNGRTFHQPPTDGTPWLNDAAGNATWTGVSLRNVLALAKPKEIAIDVVAWGADLDTMGRSLPMGTAMQPEILLVHTLNGEPLPEEHGGPVRLLVPGWAGIASTKWLTHLELLAHPYTGHYQGTMYTFYDADETPLWPVRQMPVKSLIARPVGGEHLPPGETTITGYAWSGYAGIAKVDISLDGGSTWRPSRIVEAAGPLSWVRWEYSWQAVPGEYTVCSRAEDQRGSRQPATAVWNARGYLMNAIHRISVTVR